MKFRVKKNKVLRNLFVIIILLVIGSLFSVYLLFNTTGMDAKVTRLIVKLLNVNMEANLPTFFLLWYY